MATSNQIAAKNARETERANRSKEAENVRSNKAREKETYRSNKENERQGRIKTNAYAVKSATGAAKDLMGSLTSAAALVNNPEWYAKDPFILNSVASISFGGYAGEVCDYKVEAKALDGRTATIMSPGVMTLYVAPTIGSPTSEYGKISPVNLAARSFYTWIRHVNSGSRNYDANDLMLYLIAADSLYSFHAWMKRIYGLLMTYNVMNRYMPRILFSAQGLDYDDFSAHITDLRSYINLFAERLNSMAVPASMPIYRRHEQMYSEIYKDANDPKAQMYMYSPEMFYQLNVSEFTTLVAKPILPLGRRDDGTFKDRMTFEDLVKYGNELISPILTNSDEDFATMSGDILHAYSESDLIKAEKISEDYRVEPIFNYEMLLQFNNAEPLPYHNNYWQGEQAIGQNAETGDIEFSPAFVLATHDMYANDVHILNYQHDLQPSPAVNMVATRLACQYKLDNHLPNEGLGMYSIVSCGTEIVTRGSIFTYATRTGVSQIPFGRNLPLAGPNRDVITLGSLRGVALIGCFQFAPAVFLASRPSNMSGIVSGTTTADQPIFNLGYFTFYDNDVLRRLHEVATMTEFAVTSPESKAVR